MSAGALDTRDDPFHLVFAVQLHFLELDFFQEGFRIQVGGRTEFLEFRFVFRVLLDQTLILGVCIEEYVPRAPLQACHAFLLMTGV
jgi:hypothetical protein